LRHFYENSRHKVTIVDALGLDALMLEKALIWEIN
jgi:hypothetical protein